MYHHASVPPTYYASSSSEETNHQHHQYYYHTHNQQQQQQQQQQQPNALHSFKGPINNYSNSTSFFSFSETNTPIPTPTNQHHQRQHQHQHQHYYNQSSSFLTNFDASSSSSGFLEQQQNHHHQANHIIVGVSPSTSSVRSNNQHQVNHNNNSTANVTATSPSSSSAASHNNSKRASKFPSFLLPSPRSTTSASSVTAAGTNVANVSPVLRATAATNTTNSNDASSSTHEEQPSSLLHSSGTTSTSVPSSTSSLERQQRQMEEEERVKLCRLYNNTPFSKVANEYNLHGPVLSDKEGLLFVPYPTRYQYDFIISSQRDREQKQHQELRHLRSMTTDQNQNKEEEEDDQHTSTFFLGRLPLIVNKEMIESLLRVIGGVIPISITITTAVKNAKGNYTSPLAMIVVRRCDEHRLLANIHRRVIFDQTGFQLAINEDQLFIMQRYCKMLARGRGRFQHRPFVPITVTKANPASLPKGHAPIHDNEYNPLCKCTACQDIFHKVSDYSLLFDEYLPKVVGDPYYKEDEKNDQTGEDTNEKQQDRNHHELDVDDDDDDGTSSAFTSTSTEFFLNGNAGKGSGLVKHFRLNRLIRTHAFRKIENLETDLEKHLYCDVSTKCLNECTGKALNHWPFYRYAVWDDDKVDFNCAAVVTANNYSKNKK